MYAERLLVVKWSPSLHTHLILHFAVLLSKTVDVFCFGGFLLYKLEAQEAFAFLDIFFNVTEILQQKLCRVNLKLITFKQGKKKKQHNVNKC